MTPDTITITLNSKDAETMQEQTLYRLDELMEMLENNIKTIKLPDTANAIRTQLRILEALNKGLNSKPKLYINGAEVSDELSELKSIYDNRDGD